jgi:hypothetical protein
VEEKTEHRPRKGPSRFTVLWTLVFAAIACATFSFSWAILERGVDSTKAETVKLMMEYQAGVGRWSLGDASACPRTVQDLGAELGLAGVGDRDLWGKPLWLDGRCTCGDPLSICSSGADAAARTSDDLKLRLYPTRNACARNGTP